MAPAHEARCMCRRGSLDIQRAFDGDFPFGTLAVNVAGCMLFGVRADPRRGASRHLRGDRPILLVGFTGAFTTFSLLGQTAGSTPHPPTWPSAAGVSSLACGTRAATCTRAGDEARVGPRR